MSSKPAKYEVLIKKCLRSILDINALAGDIALCSWVRHFTFTVPFSTQVYKWVLVNFLLGGSSAMKYRPIQGEIKILPVTSCYRTRNKPCDCKGGTGLKQPPRTYPCSGVREASMDEH